MKKYLMILTTLISFSAINVSTFAGTSEVTWTNPDEYRDIKSGNEPKKAYQARVFKDLEKHFVAMASHLPDGHTLKVNVTDVDLAGDVNASGIERIRIVRDLYFPRLKFNYVLVDGSGSEVKVGGINLKDMGFLMGNNLRYRNKSLGYEKKMLDEWFKNTFDGIVVKS